jgi:TolA-binding protein
MIAAAALAAATAAAAENDGSSDAAKVAYASAAALQNREAWDLAAEEWAALVKNNPADPLALKGRYYLAICQQKNGQWPEAAKTLRDVIASKADAATVALARWELARGEFQAAQAKPSPEAYASAAAQLGEFLDKSPGQPQAADAIFFLGESLWQAGKRNEALDAWTRFTRDHAASPRLPEVLYALGVGQAEKGDREAAAATLKRFADAFPAHKLAPDVALWRADVAIAAGRPADAEQALAPIAAGKGPRLADALERLGTLRWNQKNWPGAAEAFGRLATEFPQAKQASAAALSAGMAWAEAGRTDDARRWLEKLATADVPQAADAAHKLAALEFEAKRPARAADVATKALAALAGRKEVPPAALARLEIDRADALWEIPDRRREAADAYAAIVEKYPNEPPAKPALSMLALALLEQGKPGEAVKQADLYLRKHGGDATAPAVLDIRAIRAEALLADNRQADAAAAFRDLAAAAPQSPQRPGWQLREATARAAGKEWQKVRESVAAALRGLKEDAAAEAMLLDATALVELGKPADAAKVLAALDASHPKWPRRSEALLLAVRATREAGDAKAALEQAERLVGQYPDGPFADVAWYRLGQLRQDAAKCDEAIAAYAKARAAKPKGARAPWALLATGWCHEAKGRLPDAIKAWSELIESHPDSSAAPAALMARGDARQRSGDFKGGLADADAFLKSAPAGGTKPEAVAEARFLRGLCLAGEKRYGEAAAAFKQLLDEQPSFPAAERVLFEQAAAQLLDGRRSDAEATFRRLVEKFPNGGRAAEAWLEIGEAGWDAGRWDEAAKAYQAAIAAGGDAAILERARHKLGWTHAMRKDHAAAAAAFADQIAKHPAGEFVADAQAMRGDSLARLGKHAEAAEAFAAALATPAKLSSDELRGMAAVRGSESAARLEKWDESLAIAERFLADRPQSASAPQARYAAAWARQNLGQLDKAIAGYREIADAARTELSARARLMEGEVLFEQGDHKEAIKAFFKVAYGFGEKQAPPAFHPWQAQATFEAARCFEVLGKPGQARRLYAELVERYPDAEQAPAARKRLAALPAQAAETAAGKQDS